MKKIIFSMIAAMMSLAAMAQSDVWCWKDGAATKVESLDSITFEAPNIYGHEYVDLGLSVKWATTNVGATKPEDYGDFFAWGETTPKENYSWDTYKWTTDGGSTFIKYNNTDNKKVLDIEDDAAAANWGGAWRMPTFDEIMELFNTDNCSWEWTTENGVRGYKVTSKKTSHTDKCIFLPDAGFRYDSNRGTYCYYWSATRSENSADKAYFIYAQPEYREYRYDIERYYGFTVRPVRP